MRSVDLSPGDFAVRLSVLLAAVVASSLACAQGPKSPQKKGAMRDLVALAEMKDGSGKKLGRIDLN